MTDLSTIDPALLDVVKLEAWLESKLPGGGPLVAARLGADTGIGNALFTVRWNGEDMVLRRPPATKITASAGNTDRERRLLSALADTNVRHPRLILACDDLDVLGVPFVLMQKIDGFTPGAGLPVGYDTADNRHKLGFEAIDALAELALVDWEAVGLQGFGKPDGFLERQVDRWLWQLGTYKSREIEGLDELTGWLRANLPTNSPSAIMHGDYSLFNVMFSHGLPVHLAAIVDWDTATIGDPLMDLGHLLGRWDEVGETPTSLGSRDIPDRTGLAKRKELADRYAAKTGWDLSNIDYYQAISLYKLGVIMEGHYATAIKTGAANPETHSQTADGLIKDALRIAHGERS